MPMLSSGLWRNPLAYPAGCVPGFDPTHVAANGTRFSAIASDKNNLSLVGSPFQGTASGSTFAPKILAGIGPAVNYSSSAEYRYAGQSTVNDTSATIAGIFVVDGATGSSQILFSSEFTLATGGWAINLFNLTLVRLACVGSGNFDSGLEIYINVGTPYFLAMSSSGAKQAAILVNLLSGQTYTATGTVTQTSTAPPSGTYSVGNANAGRVFNGSIAAVMFNNIFLGLPQLKQWAADPWSFWYPQSDSDRWIATSGFPWWAVRNNDFIIGTGIQ